MWPKRDPAKVHLAGKHDLVIVEKVLCIHTTMVVATCTRCDPFMYHYHSQETPPNNIQGPKPITIKKSDSEEDMAMASTSLEE